MYQCAAIGMDDERLAEAGLISVFFFNDTATTEIYTLSLHDALPIFVFAAGCAGLASWQVARRDAKVAEISRIVDNYDAAPVDRNSTRLNSSHANIPYAVFCLKKTKILISLYEATSVRDQHFWHGE